MEFQIVAMDIWTKSAGIILWQQWFERRRNGTDSERFGLQVVLFKANKNLFSKVFNIKY